MRKMYEKPEGIRHYESVRDHFVLNRGTKQNIEEEEDIE